ncbi:MAG: NUDIX hydrolase [Albidovulum sp.]|nr:NUDIX hydrolase [Albidovulum sp.]
MKRVNFEVNEIEIRNAASVVLVRDRLKDPKVLVGQRGRRAVFMPSKFVFPGGAVDDCDFAAKIAGPICDVSRKRLLMETDADDAEPFFSAAIREVWEETGIRLAVPAGSEFERRQSVGAWRKFMSGGMKPCAKGLYFFFRAITPPGRSRRFDARFFLGCAEELPLAGGLDEFGTETDELVNLRWASISETRMLDIPFISGLVLDAAEAALSNGFPPKKIPFHFQTNGKRRIKFLN